MSKRHDGVSRFDTLFWYLVSETLFSFFVAFLFFFFIFFINQLLLMAEQILSKKAPFGQVALLILYSLPAIVAMAAPFASLVGTLMAVGRITTDNEVLVMRAAGMPYRIIVAPLVFVGLLISLVSFFANDVLLPAGTLEFGHLYRKLLLSTPAVEIEANSIKHYKDTTLITGNVNGTTIDKLLILDRTGNGERRVIVSDSATLEQGGSSTLLLRLNNAYVQIIDDGAKNDFDFALADLLTYSIKQKDLVQTIGAPGPREMSSKDVASEIRKRKQVLLTKAETRTGKALEELNRLEDILKAGPSARGWSERSAIQSRVTSELDGAKKTMQDRNLRIYRLEFYKKFSIPFGALSFVFLAAPLGMMARKSGQSVGFGLGLLIAVLYWAMLIGGQTLGTRLGYSPFWSMWLPNIIAITAGAVLSIVRFRR